jgi:hypothetical protein
MPVQYAGHGLQKPDRHAQPIADAGFSHIRYPGQFAQL